MEPASSRILVGFFTCWSATGTPHFNYQVRSVESFTWEILFTLMATPPDGHYCHLSFIDGIAGHSESDSPAAGRTAGRWQGWELKLQADLSPHS